MNVEHEKESQTQKCPLGVFHAPAFVADFPPIALEFHHCTHRVRLRNLDTTDKKNFLQNQAQKDSESTHVLYLIFTFDTLTNQLVVSQSEHFSIRCMLVPAYYSPFKHILYLYPAGNHPAYSYFSLSGTNDQITHAILDHLNAAAFCNTMFFHPFPDFCTCHHPLNSTDFTRLHFC